MLYRRLSPSLMILALTIFTVFIAITQATQQRKKIQQCQCLNGGKCSNDDKYMACNCPTGFIGTKCETTALDISNSDQQTIISQNYTYFYFQPRQVNYYQISLKICLPQNQNTQLTNLIFLQVQRSSGKLKLQPSIYQTSPISFQAKQDRCQTFYTNYIPIRKKVNEEFQKVIFGVAIKNNSDTTANRWVNFLQKSLSGSNQLFKSKGIADEDSQSQQSQSDIIQVQSQKITISCSYELYLVQNYWGTAIVIMSAMTLFISTAVFLYTIRNRYTYTFSNQDILRLYAINPQDFANNNQRAKNDLTHFNIIMPSMTYQLFKQKQKRARTKFPKNILKRRIQMNMGANSVQRLDKQQKYSKCCKNQRQIHKNDQEVYSTDSMKKDQIQKIREDSTSSHQSHQNLCTICLLNYQADQNVRLTPCRHLFHSQCIDNWCQNTLNCPVCRHNLQMPLIFTKRQVRALIQH